MNAEKTLTQQSEHLDLSATAKYTDEQPSHAVVELNFHSTELTALASKPKKHAGEQHAIVRVLITSDECRHVLAKAFRAAADFLEAV